MEAHVAYMAIYLPTYQYPFFLAFSTHERMAPIAKNTDPYAYFSAINGRFFTKVARFV